MTKKVFVSGCYDMLHSGHVAFFKEASSHGDLYVGLGSDKTVKELKGNPTVNTESERLFMVQAIRYVKDAWVNSGGGLMDFEKELRELKPDIFFVNEDGYTPDKLKFCKELGIELKVSKRIPHGDLPARSTTALRKVCKIPYRLDLGGGWLDQPYVSKHYPGAVITISVHPDYQFNDRSGMSSSTRKKAITLWQSEVPEGERELLAKTLFSFENPPGTAVVSGSQDSIGIVYPGVNRLNYDKGEYWPSSVEPVLDNDVLDFIEQNLWFVGLGPRTGDYDVLANTNINEENAKALAVAADNVWRAVQDKNIEDFGRAFRESFEAQVAMFPNMVNDGIAEIIDIYRDDVRGWKLSGAGGGGYLVLVSDRPVENAFRIRIVRG